MKLQHLILIFLCIMLPLSVIMSQYIGIQIDAVNEKNKYNKALLGAAYDSMSAFEINTISANKTSSVADEEIREVEAVIKTFANSISATLGKSGESTEEVLSNVPALIFTMYDGYYVYANNHISGLKELKPYAYYTKTYSNISTNTEITISYSLDNYVSVYGKYNGKIVAAAGYLVVPEDVAISNNFAYITESEGNNATVNKVVNMGNSGSWVKYKGLDIVQENLYENSQIENSSSVEMIKKSSTDAMLYYYEAYKFTQLYNTIIGNLKTEDKNILYIDKNNDPEDKGSPFMNEKVEIIKDSISKDLNAAIYNYEGAVSENYEMPQLNGEDWDKILYNVSIVAFMKDIQLGIDKYNNYVVVNSTTTQKYCSPESIDFIEYDSGFDYRNDKPGFYYHKITCEDLIEAVENGKEITGYAECEFERQKFVNDNEIYYYYKHSEYRDYNCKVKSIKNTDVSEIEKLLEVKYNNIQETSKKKILTSYYSAVGRIRYKLYKASHVKMIDKNVSFRITYNLGNGSQNHQVYTTEKINVGIKSNGEIIQPIIPIGESFKGWSFTSGSNIVDIPQGATLYAKNGAVLNLYPVFVSVSTVRFDLKGGSSKNNPNFETITYTYENGDQFLIPGDEIIRNDDYKFKGYGVTINGIGKIYEPGKLYTLLNREDEKTTLTLEAIYENDNFYTITYDPCGKGNKEHVLVQSGKNTTLKTLNSDKAIFRGWTTIKGSEPEYSPGDEYTVNGNKTLYACWKTYSCTIKYDSNAPDVNLQDSKYNNDYNECHIDDIFEFYYLVKGVNNPPERTGYTFEGWSIIKNDYNNCMKPGEKPKSNDMIGNDELILYAVWSSEKYKVTYNEGSDYDIKAMPNPKEYEVPVEQEYYEITTTIPSKTGHIFKGWSTTPDDTNVEYKAGDKYYGKKTLHLFPVWEKAKYQITFYANGGIFDETGNERYILNYEYGEEVKFEWLIPKNGEMKFVGWGSSSTSAKDEFSDRRYIGDSRTLYAVWASSTEEYFIYYNTNDVEEKDQIISEYNIPGGTVKNITNVKPYKKGWNFDGWKNQDEKIYLSGSTYNGANGSLILSPIWSRKGPFSVHYVVDGNNVFTDSGLLYDDAYVIGGKIEEPYKAGYSFLGWGSTSNTTTVVPDGALANIGESDITYYAIFKPYTITYNKNTDDNIVNNMPSPQAVNGNSNILTISSNIPTRKGFKFDGWYTNTASTGTKYSKGSSIEMNENITLYAKWTANTLVVYKAGDNPLVVYRSGSGDKTGYSFDSSYITLEPKYNKTIIIDEYIENKYRTLYATVWYKNNTTYGKYPRARVGITGSKSIDGKGIISSQIRTAWATNGSDINKTQGEWITISVDLTDVTNDNYYVYIQNCDTDFNISKIELKP